MINNSRRRLLDRLWNHPVRSYVFGYFKNEFIQRLFIIVKDIGTVFRRRLAGHFQDAFIKNI